MSWHIRITLDAASYNLASANYDLLLFAYLHRCLIFGIDWNSMLLKCPIDEEYPLRTTNGKHAEEKNFEKFTLFTTKFPSYTFYLHYIYADYKKYLVYKFENDKVTKMVPISMTGIDFENPDLEELLDISYITINYYNLGLYYEITEDITKFSK